MGKSDAIGVVELGMVQGFRCSLKCENQTDESKIKRMINIELVVALQQSMHMHANVCE